MTSPHDEKRSPGRLFAELKRRSVFRVAAVYGVVGFTAIQAADAMFPRIPLPDWTVSLVVWLILLGFPVALVLAWAFETTPEGVHRTRTLPATELDARAARPAGRRWPIGVAGLVGGALLVGGAWFALEREPTAPRPAGADGDDRPLTVAVVAATVSEDDRSEGLAGLLARGIDNVPGLRSAPENLVIRAWQARDPAAADSTAALEVARSVGASAAVVVSTASLGSPLRLYARVHPLGPSSIEGGLIQVQGSEDELIELADRLVIRVVAMLLPGEARETASIASVSTRSLPAMRAFLLGEQAMRRSAFAEAVPHFARAVEEDSTFALAWHRLRVAYGWTGELAESDEAGLHAARHADQLPARERLIVRGYGEMSAAGGRLSEVENAVRRNPEDWEFLWLLSELYLHDGWRAGISPRTADSVRALAWEAAPGNADLLFHGIDLGLGVHRDSALAMQRIEQLEAILGRRAAHYRLLVSLVFDDDRARHDSLLAATPDADFTGFPYPLAHPLSSDALVHVNGAIAGRDVLWSKLEPAFFTLVTQGRLETAIEQAATPDTSLIAASSGLTAAPCLAYMLHAAGADLAGTAAPRWLSTPISTTDLSVDAMVCLGGYAVDEGRWGDAEAWIGRLRAAASGLEDAPDANPALASATALETYLRWARGTSDEPILRSTRLDADYDASWPIRWWTARMLERAGRTGEALDVYESFWSPSWIPAHLERAELSRRLGRHAEARELYDVVLTMWSDADPGLQPLVERARAGRAALAGDSTARLDAAPEP